MNGEAVDHWPSLGRCDFTTHDHAEVASMFVTYHCAYFSWGGGGGIILISGDKLCRT